jgi:drug/metabolite transporter (DMT)-like permease
MQDNQCVKHCGDPDPTKHIYFRQPVLQTAQMFIGEAGCWIVVGSHACYRFIRSAVRGHRAPADANSTTSISTDDEQTRLLMDQSTIVHQPPKQSDAGNDTALNILLLALPAICDILGTTLMNAGLLLVAASVYQMTRGMLVLFVALFSVIFLRRHLYLFQWVSLVGVVAGVAIVGLAGAIHRGTDVRDNLVLPAQSYLHTTESSATHDDPFLTVLGIGLIAGAQIFTALQFVLEEWILGSSTMEPIHVVGWEGVFGFTLTILGMMALHRTTGNSFDGAGGPFDAAEGWKQMTENNKVAISSVLIMISIGGFNFFGLSVTRSVSATSRSTIDTCRTLFIWMISLGLGWESFKWLQVAGFLLLVYFTFLFNGMVQPPLTWLMPNDDIEDGESENPST